MTDIENAKRYGLTLSDKDVTTHNMCELDAGDYVRYSTNTGDYVKYSDYAALIAKVRELEKDKAGLVDGLAYYANTDNDERQVLAQQALKKHGGEQNG